MLSHLTIDDSLLEEAFSVGRLRTKRETVRVALEEIIERRKQLEILRALGSFEFRRSWDYKKDRRTLKTSHRS